MCDGKPCLAVRQEGDQVVLVGDAPTVERFSTLLLHEAVHGDSPWLRYDGERIEIRASNRTVVYQVTEPPAAGRAPSDDEFVTGRLIQEVPADA